MNKSRMKYIIISIIILLLILTIIFRKMSYYIEGITVENGNFIKCDLGTYDKNKIYNKYPVHILTKNSDFNILKVFGIDVKYPSNLTLEDFSENKLIAFTDKSKKLIFTIQNIKNEDKKTVKYFLEDNNEAFKNIISDKIDIYQQVQGNKIIKIGKSKDKSVSFLIIYEIGENIKYLSLYDLNNTENIDSIIDTVKSSYKLKE